ncbi:DUF6003 family protein [Streptomyces europaeiscabiei]|uniref:DUF6003 family protein n=1 Tax=Streptomyces europaeiscabiei TaxID=146819 RepID=A0ABU4NLW7_9ACTN|nr:DUF6003 family protein [Streptomyces europaeiscabiei]MDX2524329.1 DUF6003 family protein [Streptomyces europaeiscabiei]MDX2757624.1 DUF6003 family protein [Streptomyces europaeiscabiei]MDX2767103.1 DUF6003 family protein [Streptomyces europaeiscabiei]MDX3545593.1 DUF6003 family protein [Streptomyces europaeiscabiei]MDX3555010.1 DUF6003 family protein [Streptomyces europaeiscabiei]
MTDDAYLFLLDDVSAPLGVAPAAVDDLACMETPAVRAWLDAQGSTLTSPYLRMLPPEETAAIPEGAERLPVPLSDEELSRVRHLMAPEPLARVEEELLSYRDCADGRDGLIARALAAGVPPHRIVELTGVDPATVTAAASG